MTDGGEGELRLEEVLGAYLEASDAGWAPEPRAFIARYPELTRELEAFFQSQARFAHLAASLPALAPGRGREPPPRPDAPTRTFAPSAPTDPALTQLRHFGDYEVLRPIARGGMGIVFRARQCRPVERVVALKMILAGQFASPAEVQRFLDEAASAAHLDHPHIVPIYHVGQLRGQYYYTMKLIEGDNLGVHLERLGQDLRAAAGILATVARAVHHAHQRGILHRDLKPANILLEGGTDAPLDRLVPYVTDFGLAKRLRPVGPPAAGEEGQAYAAPEEVPAGGVVPSGTAGTPGYMPPEQEAGPRGVLTTASDVYSLGAILYKVLTGQVPGEGRVVGDAEPPESPRALNPRVDRDLEAVCLKCLEREPGRRYASAEELAEELERWRRGAPVRARRRPWPWHAWRAARRNWLLSLIAALVGSGLGAWGLDWYLSDRDRTVRGLERQLARGEAVALIGETGGPRWQREATGDRALLVSTTADRPFSFSSFGPARLELLTAAPPRGYRFRAEVRRDRGDSSLGEVGIFFGLSPRAGGHCWGELVFREKREFAKPKPNLKPKAVIRPSVELRVRTHEGPQGRDDLLLRLPGAQKMGAPVGRAPPERPWHSLAVEVTPEKVTAFWEGKAIGSAGWKALTTPGSFLPPGARGAGEVLPLSPRGGLGLFVDRGVASFRQVVVEPLP